MNDASAITDRTQLPDSVVLEALDKYLKRLEQGEPITKREMLSEYPPEVAEALESYLGELEELHQAAQVFDPQSDEHAASQDGQPATGTIGDFRILRQVGRGGMGIVYEAEQISLGRRVALKVLPFAAVLDERQIRRFKNEASAAAQLQHPNIVRVHAVGQQRGVHYFAMEFIDGVTLSEVVRDLRRSEGLEPDDSDGLTLSTRLLRPSSEDAGIEGADEKEIQAEADTNKIGLSTEGSIKSPAYFKNIAQIGIQVAEALDHAHQEGVVHRDIKPSNLMLDQQGHVWVTDFGLARIESDPGVSMTGDILGTLRYMSPEQALAQRSVLDHRTDIYSLGVTLYELLTLRPAVGGDDRQQVLHRIANVEPPPPRQWNKSIPKDLETILLKAIAKEPAERYATAQELADDLGRFCRDEHIEARRPSALERAEKWSRRHPSAVRAVVAVLFIATALLSMSIYLISQNYYEAVALKDHETDLRQLAQQAEAKAVAATEQMRTEKKRAERNYFLAYETSRKSRKYAERERWAEWRLGETLPTNLKEVQIGLLEDALWLHERLERGPATTPYSDLGIINLNLGLYYWEAGRRADAEQAFQAAIAHLRQRLAETARQPRLLHMLARTLTEMSKFYREDQRNDEARALLAEATPLLEQCVEIAAHEKNWQRVGFPFEAMLAENYLLTGRTKIGEGTEYEVFKMIESLVAHGQNDEAQLALKEMIDRRPSPSYPTVNRWISLYECLGLYTEANALSSEYRALEAPARDLPVARSVVDHHLLLDEPGEYQLYARCDGGEFRAGLLSDGQVLMAYTFDGDPRYSSDTTRDGNFTSHTWRTFVSRTHTDRTILRPAVFQIPHGGEFTLRMAPNATKTAVDALILQRSDLPPPMEEGPPESRRNDEGVFVAADGRVVIEAEHFSSRMTGDDKWQVMWRVVPKETEGKPAKRNHRGDGYVQALPVDQPPKDE